MSMAGLVISLISFTAVQFATGWIFSHVAPQLKIIGGHKAKLGQIPYQVSLRSLSSSSSIGHFCGGSILSDRLVLTAAHCLYQRDPKDLYVVAGSLQLADNGSGQCRRVESYVCHNKYKKDDVIYDIAVIKLDTPLHMDNLTVKAADLQLVDTPAGSLCEVSGWGVTKDNGTTIPNDLMVVTVFTSDWDTCVHNYSKLGSTVPNSGMICAGYPGGGRDSCSGDSGGPLMCGGRLTGVVSWGAGCALKDLPGVYTNVSFFQTWIAAHSGTIVTTDLRRSYIAVLLGYFLIYLINN